MTTELRAIVANEQHKFHDRRTANRRQEEVDRAIERIKALRTRTRKITLDELLSARHEGHKYDMRFVLDASVAARSIDRAPEETAVLTLARKYRLTVYDASYLELAQREALPLATLDKELQTAANAAGVMLLV